MGSWFGQKCLAIAEDSPANEGNSQSVEIPRRNIVELCKRPAVSRRFALAFGKHRSRKSPAERKIGCHRRALDSRRCPGPLDRRAEELLRAPFPVMQRTQVKCHHEKI